MHKRQNETNLIQHLIKHKLKTKTNNHNCTQLMILTKHGINQEFNIKCTSKPEPVSLYDLLATVHFHMSHSVRESVTVVQAFEFLLSTFSVLLFCKLLTILFCKALSEKLFWSLLSFLEIFSAVPRNLFFCRNIILLWLLFHQAKQHF